MGEGEQRDASVDGPVSGNEVGPNGDNPRSGGGGDLHLWSSSDVRVSRSPGDNVSSLGDALESHQRTGWCSAELVSAGSAQGAYEQHGTLRKVKDAEMMVCNFRGQMQCRMGGKREGPIEMYPKFWNLNPLTADGREILRIPAWKECFALVKRELETIMEKEILPATMPEFPIVRRMTLGMNSPLVVPSIMARMRAEEMQKDFTDGWDPCSLATRRRSTSIPAR